MVSTKILTKLMRQADEAGLSQNETLLLLQCARQRLHICLLHLTEDVDCTPLVDRIVSDMLDDLEVPVSASFGEVAAWQKKLKRLLCRYIVSVENEKQTTEAAELSLADMPALPKI